MRSILVTATVAIGLIVGAPTIGDAQTKVSTRSATEAVVGLSGDALIGQSFVAPVGKSFLRRWQMAVAVSEPGGQFQAGVWSFNPDTRTRGALIWQNSVQDAPTWDFRPSLEVPFTTFEVDLLLQEGVHYLFGVITQSSGRADIRSLYSDIAYSDGGFYYWWAPNYTGLDQAGSVGLSSDLAFEAQFEPATEVPEPETGGLVCIGLIGLAHCCRRHRNARRLRA